MIIPAYLPYYVVTGAIGVIATILFGLSKALSKSVWGASDRFEHQPLFSLDGF